MNLNNRGEVATILTIATFVFIGVASLTSSYFLNKPQTTATSAQLRTAAFSGSEAPGGACAIPGDWRVKCENKQAGCPANEGVALPYQCTNGTWTLTNPSGECNLTCPVSGTTNPPSSGSGTGSGDGGSCAPFQGGADSKGCGGTDGCRFWEVCMNGGCIDTTNGNGSNPPGPDACINSPGTPGSPSTAPVTNPSTAPAGGSNPPTTNKSCTVGNQTYAHGDRYCTGAGDVGQCNNGQLTTYNDCVASLPCNPNTRQCATTPVNPSISPVTGGTTGGSRQSCQILGQTIPHGQRLCNSVDDLWVCNNGKVDVVDCPTNAPCNSTYKQCVSQSSQSGLPPKVISAPPTSTTTGGNDPTTSSTPDKNPLGTLPFINTIYSNKPNQCYPTYYQNNVYYVKNDNGVVTYHSSLPCSSNSLIASTAEDVRIYFEQRKITTSPASSQPPTITEFAGYSTYSFTNVNGSCENKCNQVPNAVFMGDDENGLCSCLVRKVK